MHVCVCMCVFVCSLPRAQARATWMELIRQQTARLLEQADVSARLHSGGSLDAPNSFTAASQRSHPRLQTPDPQRSSSSSSSGANPGASDDLHSLLADIALAEATERADNAKTGNSSSPLTKNASSSKSEAAVEVPLMPPRLKAARGLLGAHATFTRRLACVCEALVAPLEDISKGDPTGDPLDKTGSGRGVNVRRSDDSSSGGGVVGTTTMLGAASNFVRRAVKVDLQALMLRPDVLVFLQVDYQIRASVYVLV